MGLDFSWDSWFAWKTNSAAIMVLSVYCQKHLKNLAYYTEYKHLTGTVITKYDSSSISLAWFLCVYVYLISDSLCHSVTKPHYQLFHCINSSANNVESWKYFSPLINYWSVLVCKRVRVTARLLPRKVCMCMCSVRLCQAHFQLRSLINMQFSHCRVKTSTTIYNAPIPIDQNKQQNDVGTRARSRRLFNDFVNCLYLYFVILSSSISLTELVGFFFLK